MSQIQIYRFPTTYQGKFTAYLPNTAFPCSLDHIQKKNTKLALQTLRAAKRQAIQSDKYIGDKAELPYMAVAGEQHGLYCTYAKGTWHWFCGTWIFSNRGISGVGIFTCCSLLSRVGFSFLFFQLAVCKPCRELMAKFTLSLSLLGFCSLFLDALGAQSSVVTGLCSSSPSDSANLGCAIEKLQSFQKCNLPPHSVLFYEVKPIQKLHQTKGAALLSLLERRM